VEIKTNFSHIHTIFGISKTFLVYFSGFTYQGAPIANKGKEEEEEV